MKQLLMTGHLGLVGRHLQPLLEARGYTIKGYDVANASGDICNTAQLENALQDCDGIVHLAAVSRVIWGEQNPVHCWLTNAIASENLLKLALRSSLKPWVLVTSSREVYGEAEQLPVAACAPVKPVNVYGRSKAYMEDKALLARAFGLNTAVVRLANVYGCTEDHLDRVLPAFCYNATNHSDLRVDGKEHLFDFTHINDTVAGLALIIEQLEHNERQLPPLHLLPGMGTTLVEAAHMAINAAGSRSNIIEAASRSYDVSRFIGDPSLAKALLGWQATVTPKQGIEQLVAAFKQKAVKGLCV